jgi:CheY-like chemotaxis protein
VLTDKLMPVMDGVDMAHRLRAEFGRGSIPVIMVSGSASQGEARELLEGAVESFLPKPLNLDLLYAEAARLCKVEYDYCEAEPPADQRGRGQA